MRKLFWLILIVLLLSPLSSYAITTYNCNGLIGAGQRDLDYLSVVDLNDDDRAIVLTDTFFYLFKYVSTASDAEDILIHPFKVRPDDFAIAGVWIEQELAMGDVDSYGGLAAAVALWNADGSAVTLEVRTSQTSLSANLTVNSNISLSVPKGGLILIDTGKVLTFSGSSSLLQAGAYQIFSGAGSVSFTEAQTVWADWWAATKNAAALTAAYTAVKDGSSIRMSGGTWNFATSSVGIGAKTVHISGVGFDTASGEGTEILHTGAAEALLLGGQATLEKIRISGGVYGLRLGDAGGTHGAFAGAVRDVYLTGASTAGLYAHSIQLGYLENVFMSANSGAGMEIATGTSTVGVFDKCRWRANGTMGILYSNGANFRYYGCIWEWNDEEAIKATAGAMVNTIIDGAYISDNNNDGTRADGYFSILADNIGNHFNIISNTRILTPTTPWNGSAGNKRLKLAGTWTLLNNSWASGSTPYIDLVNNCVLRVFDLALQQNNPATINPLGNARIDGIGIGTVWPYTANGSIYAFGGEAIVSNAGASGAITLSLPNAEAGLCIRVSIAAAYAVHIDPLASDQIRPLTTAGGNKISNSGNLGDSITLYGLDSTYWTAIAQTGIWYDSDGTVIRALADEATPSVKGWDKWLTGGTTTITDFDDGVEGQIMHIVAEHSVDIDVDAGNIFLNGAVDYSMTATDTLTLICKADNKWYELSRSAN